MPVNASVRRRMCVSVSGLMYRDAPTTAANLGAFVRLIFIYPPHEKGRKERGNCVSIMLRRPSGLPSFLPSFFPCPPEIRESFCLESAAKTAIPVTLSAVAVPLNLLFLLLMLPEGREGKSAGNGKGREGDNKKRLVLLC